MRKSQKFGDPAFAPTVTSTYAGEASSDYIAAALLSAKTLDQGNVNIHPNVKYKEVIQKLDVGSIVNDASCNFETTGSVAISEVVLEPKELQVNLELCKQNFLDSWEAISMGYSAFDEIPRNFTDYLISYVGGKVAEATETAIWDGAIGNGSFLGYVERLTIASGSADSPTFAQSGSVDYPSVALTKDNIIDALQAVYDAIPSAVYGKDDLVIYLSTKGMKLWQASQSGQVNVGSFNSQLNVGEKPTNFQGIELVHAPGLTASENVIIAAQKSNLHFGTGLLSDYNEVRVLDMADIDGSQNFRVIMRYTAGTAVGINNEVTVLGLA